MDTGESVHKLNLWIENARSQKTKQNSKNVDKRGFRKDVTGGKSVRYLAGEKLLSKSSKPGRN